MGWGRSPGVVFEVVDGQAVLLDAAGAELITLNAVGTVVWEALDGSQDVEALADALHARFPDVARSDLVRDVEAFLAELATSALVSDGA